MNIALFSTEETNGGAARATNRLHLGLLQNSDVDVTFYVKNKSSDLNNVKEIKAKDKFLESIEQLVNRRYIQDNRTGVSNTLFSFSYCDSDFECMHEFDVINLHWVERFVSLNNLNELVQSGIPIVWTLHDMKPFTGGCHYSATCRAFEGDCSNCLQLTNDEKKLPQKVLRVKEKILKHANITIVTPSIWLADEAKNSFLFKDTRIEVIPNGIDSTKFKPIEKNTAKKALGIDTNSIVLTFGAMNHNERRKGFAELIQAMHLLNDKLNDKKVVALFFGSEAKTDFPLHVINAGYIDSDEKLCYIYSAADIFILPSLEDNLPNTILESLSCETPIVAFDTGGAKDIIDDSNGKIVPKGDVKALSDEVYVLINDEGLRLKKGKNGRERILNRYQLYHQASAYYELFRELKDEEFDYISSKLDVNAYFDDIIGLTYRNKTTEKEILFSKLFNTFYVQVQNLNEYYVIYGNGTVGKTIQALIPERIVAFLDHTSDLISEDIIRGKVYNPKNLENMKYDKIIISVLGREDEIVKYLVEELHVSQDKIIIFNI